MDKIRIGLTGLGYIGQIHLKLLMENPQVEVAGVCDISRKALETVKNQYQLEKLYSNFGEMIEEEEIDGVVIATPPHIHVQQALLALKKGLYVMIEKPMSTTLEEAKKIYDVAKNTNKLMIGFSLRFHGLYMKVKDYIESGKLGDIIFQWHIALGKTPPTPWIKDVRKSGGMINEHSVHMIYYFKWFAGAVKEVNAKCWRLQEDSTIEDNAVVNLIHESGAVSTILQSWTASHRWRRWGLQLTNGTVTVEGYLEGPYKITCKDNTLEEGYFKEPVEDMYRRELKHFIECIKREEKPTVNEKDGIEVQEIVEAIYMSAREGKSVKLPL